MLPTLIGSASWLAVGQIASQAYLSLAAVLAAAFLGPQQFGPIAVEIVGVSGLLLLADGGFATAIIREPEDRRSRLVRFAVGAGASVGLLVVVATVVAGGPLPLVLLGLTAPLAAFALAEQARTVAEHRFRRVGIAQASGACLALLVCGGFLLAELPEYAIPGSFVAYLVILVAVQGLHHDVNEQSVQFARPPLRFAAGAFGANLLNFFGSNVDYLVIGVLLGPTALGLYALGYVVSASIQTRVMSIVNRAAYPLMAPLDPAQRVQWYLSLVLLIIMLAAPAYAVLYIAAPVAVPLVFGQEWQPAIQVTRLLMGAGFAYTVGTSVGPFLLAAGRSDLLFGFGLLRLAGIAIAVAGLAPFGLVPATLGVVAYAWLAVPLTMVVAMRANGALIGDVIRAISHAKPVLASLALSIAGVVLADTPYGIWLVGAAVLSAVALLWAQKQQRMTSLRTQPLNKHGS